MLTSACKSRLSSALQSCRQLVSFTAPSTTTLSSSSSAPTLLRSFTSSTLLRDSSSSSPSSSSFHDPGFGPSGDRESNRKPAILEVDPYPAERLQQIEQRYKWLDWDKMAEHMHMADVHFFDQEVPYIDQDFTIKPDFKLLHRLDGANRLKMLQEHEDKKIRRLLPFGYWVTSGRNVRVATEGKIQSFWAMVVGGDKNGTGSFGFGKGEDMMIAERRAMQDLKRNLMFVPLFESRTISHELMGRHGVCNVRMWPRPRERGMTAGMIPRMIFECFGIEDITASIHGRALPHHQAMAIFNGLKQVKSLREEAIRRGVTAHRMFERGLQQPRHPGREALFKRGEEIHNMLREVRAVQAHEQLMQQVGMEEKSKQPSYYYPDIIDSPVENPREDVNCWVPGYIDRKPDPASAQKHGPAPKFPTQRLPPIKETLFTHRGLPHHKSIRKQTTNTVM